MFSVHNRLETTCFIFKQLYLHVNKCMHSESASLQVFVFKQKKSIHSFFYFAGIDIFIHSVYM